MANPAQISDLAARWRQLDARETSNGLAFLTDAWEYLCGEIPTLPDTMGTPTGPTEGQVRRVVCAMVLRVLRNPDGLVQESIDDYAYRRADAVADGLLYATPRELDSLTAKRRGRAFSITPYIDPASTA